MHLQNRLLVVAADGGDGERAQNSMAQWQVYAGTGGYAIGFSWDALAEHSVALYPEAMAIGTSPFAVGLRRMTYDTPAAEALTDSVVAELRREYEQDSGTVRMMMEGGRESGLVFVASLILNGLAIVFGRRREHERSSPSRDNRAACRWPRPQTTGPDRGGR